MAATHLSLDALVARILGDASALPIEPGAVVLVDLDEHGGAEVPAIRTGIPAVVIGTCAAGDPVCHPAATTCDVVVQRDDPAVPVITANVEEHPLAATALAVLLRSAEVHSIDDGLIAESITYSALQAGPEFRSWLANHQRRDRPPEVDPVLLARDASVLTITLNRPTVRNALNVAMREALLDAFDVVEADPTLTQVHLRGSGTAFCAGGDLDEFGTFSDPEAAHLIRIDRSVGRSIASVAERVTAHLHGACAGSGIELPAFAGRVLAHPSTVVSLPEVALGLVPGAGGTVSLPRRIGRHRTALLALSGQAIDVATALDWGLVDDLDDSDPA